MNQGAPPVLRAHAAICSWKATGEAYRVLPVFRETLPTVKDKESLVPLTYAAELGPAGKSLVPEIRTLLASDDLMIRCAAGDALRRIDHSALPPINDDYP
jgi:hypothetical protein